MLRVLFIIAVIVGIVLLHAYIVRPSPAIEKSDHFDGERFFNLEPIDHGFNLLVKWLTNRERGPWLDDQSYSVGPAPVERVNGSELLVTLVGHATLLIQTGGLNILTDPIWAQRAGPVSFLGSGRVRPAAIRFEDLPPIDLVLVSHGHYDHMDIATLKRLYKQHQPQFLLPLGQGSYLRRAGIEGIT
ncbi:MAG: MBL fold metallo-hydrolase, partial [Immundisolibacteraceae bacterium]|nr:MBL fold metallo-hydrolase [Immundisolibacteraceae bacterium]